MTPQVKCKRCGKYVPKREELTYGGRHEDCAVPQSGGGSSPSLKRMTGSRARFYYSRRADSS